MANRHRVRVLVVDEEEDTCRHFSEILTDLGDRVGRACDGETAPELVRRQPSDVVLPDLTLPGIDGLTLSREIRAAPIALNLPGSHGTEVLDLVRQPDPKPGPCSIIGRRSEREATVARRLAEGADASCDEPFDVPGMSESLDQSTKAQG
jgi:CheY-like chemotaxis protein